MKKSLIYFGSLIALALFTLSCDDTLDRNVTPVEKISAINIVVAEEQPVNPNDDSGLAPAYSTLVGSQVTFSSTTPDADVSERVWSIPQALTAASLDFEEIAEMGPITRSFSRANNTASDGERFGFPIILTETLTNGDINRLETQIQVRNQVQAGIVAPSVATANVPTSIQALNAAAMGLSSSDLDGEGQLVLEWDFGTGFIQTAAGRASTVISNNVDQSFSVIFENATDISSDGELITLTVTRTFPLRSTSTAERLILVVGGLTPNRGENKDAIKLSADGTQIIVGYEEPIGDISVISAADFELSMVTDEITNADSKATFDAITVTDVAIDPSNPNNLLLSLSSSVPSILMDNVSLSYTSRLLTSQTGGEISLFLNSTVFPTGENLLANNGSSDFEDQSKWANGGFFFPNPADSPEMTFSTEQSFDGTTSFLFDTMDTDLSTMANNFGIGANIVDNGPFPTPPDEPAQYILSMWVYVESTEPGTNIAYFLLDFAAFTTGADASTLPVGQWVKISGTRTINPGGDTRSLIRVVFTDPDTGISTTTNSRIFVDQVEVRIVDDGR